MAYFAANAVFILSSNVYAQDLLDYRKVCGAGIRMNDNLFLRNVGLKYHDGGAAIVSCFIGDGSTPFSHFGITSGHY